MSHDIAVFKFLRYLCLVGGLLPCGGKSVKRFFSWVIRISVSAAVAAAREELVSEPASFASECASGTHSVIYHAVTVHAVPVHFAEESRLYLEVSAPVDRPHLSTGEI